LPLFGALPIYTPLALRRAASRAVEATNGPAVQRLTWTPPHHGSIFLLEKKPKPSHRSAAEIFCQEKIFSESGMQTLVN
jgi:hypothetical protein